MSTRVVFLPGLGADARLFGPQIAAFDNATVPEWIMPELRESLGSYALRFAESAVEPTDEEKWIAVGFSFGGIIALEMAARLPPERRPRAVVLISGLRSKRSLTKTFRAQVAVGTLVPAVIAKPVIEGPIAAMFGKACGLNDLQQAELAAMAEEVDWDFLQWAARACAEWDSDGRCPVPVHWTHGSGDRIVPYVAHPEYEDALEIIEDKSHLLTWTKAEQINAWLSEIVASV